MFQNAKAYSGFAVRDSKKALGFYRDILGLSVEEMSMGMTLLLGSGAKVFVYQETEHEPGSYTIMYFPVDEIEAAVDALVEKGVVFERYNDPEFITTDDKGIMDGGNHKIAWFKDPSGNFLAVIQSEKQ